MILLRAKLDTLLPHFEQQNWRGVALRQMWESVALNNIQGRYIVSAAVQSTI